MPLALIHVTPVADAWPLERSQGIEMGPPEQSTPYPHRRPCPWRFSVPPWVVCGGALQVVYNPTMRKVCCCSNPGIRPCSFREGLWTNP